MKGKITFFSRISQSVHSMIMCGNFGVLSIAGMTVTMPSTTEYLSATEYNTAQLQLQNESIITIFRHTTLLITLLVILILALIFAGFAIYRKYVKRQLKTYEDKIDELQQAAPAAIQQQKAPAATAPAAHTQTSNNDFLNQIIDTINKSPDMSFSLETLAAQLGMSSQTLRRRIFAATGEAPKVLIARLKMERASRLLLENPEMPVIQVASQCGFTEASSFIRFFQNAFGMSPTQYRSRQNSMTDTTQPT